MIASMMLGMMLMASPDAAESADPTEPMEEVVAGEEAASAPAPVEDDVVCRRKFSSGNKFGERNSSIKVCKTRDEWEADRRKRR